MRHPLLFATFMLTVPAAVAAEPVQDGHDHHEEHAAHLHGSARLTAALDGRELLIELAAPAADIVGFEHQPRDGDEHRQVRRAVAQLRRASELFRLPAAAGCRLDTADLRSALLLDRAMGHHEPDHDRHSAHTDHDGTTAADGHTDFEVTYHFLCERPAALDRIGVELFRPFPSLAGIAAQFVGPTGQGATELTPGHSVLRLR
jgi:hypothetical protein